MYSYNRIDAKQKFKVALVAQKFNFLVTYTGEIFLDHR